MQWPGKQKRIVGRFSMVTCVVQYEKQCNQKNAQRKFFDRSIQFSFSSSVRNRCMITQTSLGAFKRLYPNGFISSFVVIAIFRRKALRWILWMTHGTECSRISVWLSYLNGAIDKVLFLVVFSKLLVLSSWLEHNKQRLANQGVRQFSCGWQERSYSI